MKKLSNRTWLASLLVVALVVGTAVIIFRYIKYSDDWYAHRNASPVYSQGEFLCGQIYDRSEVLLLDATAGRQYPEDEILRRANLHLLGDVEGNIPDYLMAYYRDEMNSFNLFHDATPAEDSALHLTVSGEVQKVALDALGDRKGTVGVYNYKTGEILCMVSTPSFDPLNPQEVDDSEAYEGAYINRFVHASYTPGSVFKLVTAVAAISEFADLDERRFVCDGSWQIGENTVICNSIHGEIDFDEAIAKSCNVTFAQLSTELGKERLTKYAKAAGIEQSLEFDGLKTKAGSFDLTDAGEYAVAWSGVGQYTDSINPCQFMTFVGAIANGGIAAQPYLVESTYCGGTETYKARLRYGSRLMDAEVANRLVLSMHEAVVNNYGEDRFPAQLYVGAKSGTAEQDGEKAANALFVGFTRNENVPLAFIVVIEEGGSGSGEGIPVIGRVLQACVAAMETEEK